jgi:hypothetical protein
MTPTLTSPNAVDIGDVVLLGLGGLALVRRTRTALAASDGPRTFSNERSNI